MSVARIGRTVPRVAVRKDVHVVGRPRHEVRHHGLVVAVIARREDDGFARHAPHEIPVQVLADHGGHAPVPFRADELARARCEKEFTSLCEAFFIDELQQRLLTRQERHNRRVGRAVLLRTIVARGQRIVHHHEVDLRAIELRVRLLHQMDGGREIEHPVKIGAAVIRPVFPHALIAAVAHLLHVLEDRFVLVERDAELPLIAVADRTVLTAAALPCARPLQNTDGNAVFRSGARGRQPRKARTDDYDVRGMLRRDLAVGDLRRRPEPRGRRRRLCGRRGRDEVIVGVARAAREQGRRGDESAECERAPLEEVPAAERRIMLFAHRIRSFLHPSKNIIGAAHDKHKLKVHIFYLSHKNSGHSAYLLFSFRMSKSYELKAAS